MPKGAFDFSDYEDEVQVPADSLGEEPPAKKK